MNKYERAIICIKKARDRYFGAETILEELVKRATQLDNIMNTPVERLTRKQYNVREAYIYIIKELDWSDNNE